MTKKPAIKSKKIKLVLSWWWSRWLAHIGVIKRLIEHWYTIDSISGCSAGSIVGLFVCSGIDIQEIEHIFTAIKFWDILKWNMNLTGLMNLNRLSYIIKKHITITDIKQTQIPFFVSTTDLKTGYNIIYNQWNIEHIIKASCSIPISFQPIKYDHKILVDGGITNNFPIEPFLPWFDLWRRNQNNELKNNQIIPIRSNNIIGIDINPYQWVKSLWIQETVPRSMNLLTQQSYNYKRHLCHDTIQPQKLNTIGLFQSNELQYIVDIGYEAAQEKWWNKKLF